MVIKTKEGGSGTAPPDVTAVWLSDTWTPAGMTDAVEAASVTGDATPLVVSRWIGIDALPPAATELVFGLKNTL